MSERTKIDVIMVDTMKPPRMITLNDNLELMQEAVGGWINKSSNYYCSRKEKRWR
ncbi:MAG: hypothetical protein Q4C46_11020 [Bacillota bacterium]|nr:hypothetical protein [Bacillota bacterium]